MRDLMFNIRMWLQKLFRGYSDIGIWNLNDDFARWILPRLKVFRERTFGVPLDFETLEDWQSALDDMIFSFEFYMDTDRILDSNDFDYFNSEQYKKDSERAARGRELFGKYWPNLWW